jgi:hypothetical protein
MAISDDRRHALHNRLDEVLGPDEAATLMEHLPPPWADLATKRDLDTLGDTVGLRIEALEHKMRGEFNDRLASHTRALALAITGNTAVVAMLAFAAANL